MTVPYLFVGAGISIRYANVESWAALLERFASFAPTPYEYYFSSANGDLPTVATLLAQDFHEVWWNNDRFETSRAAHAAPSALPWPLLES